MRLVFTDTRLFKSIISLIAELVNEVTFKVSKSGLELLAMDPTSVAMVVLRFDAATFSQLDIATETRLGISLNDLRQILRRLKPEDILIFETQKNRLIATLKGKHVRAFELSLLELEEREVKVPSWDLNAIIKIPTVLLQDAIEDASIVADSLHFITEEKKFRIKASSELSNVSIEIEENENIAIAKKVPETIKACYSIEYLKKMVDKKVADIVTLKYSSDYPLQLTYSLPDITFSFILAPRME